MYFIRICGSDGRPLFWEILDQPLGFLHYEVEKRLFGGPGHRSRYLSHAKRALYHLS